MKEQLLKKQHEVEALKEVISNAKTIVAFDYPGLTVAQTTKLRRALLKGNCDMKIYKNNITRRAALALDLGEFADKVVGPLALVSSSVDVVNPAKIVVDFFKELKIKGKGYKDVVKVGIIEGKVVGVNKIEELATLPNRETLLTMLAAGLLQPVKEVAIGLNMLVEEKE